MLSISTSDQVEDYLLSHGDARAWMLLLRGVKSGFVGIVFRSGLKLEVSFPLEIFPTLGIWWNDGKYPDEEGRGRVECAFEPLPGKWSSLAMSFQENACLFAPARGSMKWTIVWNLT